MRIELPKEICQEHCKTGFDHYNKPKNSVEEVCSKNILTQSIQMCCDAINPVQTLFPGALVTVFDRCDKICMYIKFQGNVATGNTRKVTYSFTNGYSVMMDIINSHTEKL